MKTWNIVRYCTGAVDPLRPKYRRVWSTFVEGRKQTFDFNVGDKVKHKTHGRGYVAKIRNGVVYVVLHEPLERRKMHSLAMVGCLPTDLKVA